MTFMMILLAYFLGSIPFSVIVATSKGIDLLTVGSKNAGATNVYRQLGLAWAICVFSLDMGKGLTAMLLGQFMGLSIPALCCLAIAVVVGHTLTPFLRFKGGKGVATGLGVLVFMSPLIFLIVFIIGLLLIKVSGYVSLGSITGAMLVMVLSWIPFFHVPLPYQLIFLSVGSYVIYKHKNNIVRLIQKKESKIL